MRTPTVARAHQLWLILATSFFTVGIAGLVLWAQGPPPPAPQVPVVQGQQAAPPAEPGAPPQGRGRRSGPDVLQGGPMANDPVYANLDFGKKSPVLALAPDEELKRLILQPGYHLELVDKLIFPRFLLPFGPNAILTGSPRCRRTCSRASTTPAASSRRPT